MPPKSRERNRGPAAAPGNRQALLAAARKLFAERGYHVPLSAIAKAAGVGQGVLYRNFPRRLDLAFAVFEENFTELEAIAADTDVRTFFRLWSRLLDYTIQDTAFLEMSVDARRTTTDYRGAERMQALIEPALARARDAGLVDPELTAQDVMTAQRMAYGLVVTSDDPGGVRWTIDHALTVLGRRWPAATVPVDATDP
ncbi:MAG TPA: helix-turn-helix domain-containing protein [Mycobacterium sp.]